MKARHGSAERVTKNSNQSRRDGTQSTLQLAQEISDLRFGPVHRPDELAAHHALAVDDKGLRPSVRPIESGGFLRGIPHGKQVDAVLLQELSVSVLVYINADSHHGY